MRHSLASEPDESGAECVATVLQLAHVAEAVQCAEQAMHGRNCETGVGCQGCQRALPTRRRKRLQQRERTSDGLDGAFSPHSGRMVRRGHILHHTEPAFQTPPQVVHTPRRCRLSVLSWETSSTTAPALRSTWTTRLWRT